MINLTQNSEDIRTDQLTHLNIAVSEKWLSYALSSRLGDQHAFAFKQSTDIKRSIQEVIEKYPGRKVRIAIENSDYTLVPRDHFRKDEVADLLKSNIGKADDLLANSDTIYSQAIKNVYGLDPALFSAFELNDVSVCHYLSPLLTYLPRSVDQVFLIWLNERAIVIVVKDERIFYAKAQDCHSAEDTLYHIVLAYKLADLNRDIDPLVAMGRFHVDSELYDLLYRYIRHIELPRVPGINGDTGHLFYDMYLLSKYL